MSATLDAKVPIPIASRVDQSTIESVKVTTSVRIAGTAARPVFEKRSAMIPIFEGSDIESLLRTILDFESACRDGDLEISTRGDLMKVKFRNCLGPTARTRWDGIVLNHPGNHFNDYRAALNEFLEQFQQETAFEDQRNYLVTAKKRMKDTVQETYDRLLFINEVSIFLRGSQGIFLYDDAQFKQVFLGMMVNEWQQGFHKSGHSVTDPHYTIRMLVDFMKIYESDEQNKRKRSDGRDGGGRGRGRGSQGGYYQVGQRGGRYQGQGYGRGGRGFGGYGRGGYYQTGFQTYGRGYYGGRGSGNYYPQGRGRGDGGRVQGRGAGRYTGRGRAGYQARGRGGYGYGYGYAAPVGAYFHEHGGRNSQARGRGGGRHGNAGRIPAQGGDVDNYFTEEGPQEYGFESPQVSFQDEEYYEAFHEEEATPNDSFLHDAEESHYLDGFGYDY